MEWMIWQIPVKSKLMHCHSWTSPATRAIVVTQLPTRRRAPRFHFLQLPTYCSVRALNPRLPQRIITTCPALLS
ncbi:Uncharacterized protein HZ326_21084 [Fusarium oxysporum f. sp. albedinis]|nr:Uncharacterized protein HZ326_21084 [Fusarium oxysporum f. sp. albedinis]